MLQSLQYAFRCAHFSVVSRVLTVTNCVSTVYNGQVGRELEHQEQRLRTYETNIFSLKEVSDSPTVTRHYTIVIHN
jgi:hypothetical protein